MDTRPLRVVILSPQDIVVRGLASMLAGHDDIRTDDTFDVSTDVVLYDVLGLHVGDGRDLERVLEHRRVTVLAVGRELRPDLLTQALVRGAHGFVNPDVDTAGLVRAVTEAPRMVARGEVGGLDHPWTPPGVDADRQLRDYGVVLTDREIDILSYIARGLSNQEVAEKCFLSINSVKTYIRTAYRKIGVESRTQAVIWCLQHGFSPQAP